MNHMPRKKSNNTSVQTSTSKGGKRGSKNKRSVVFSNLSFTRDDIEALHAIETNEAECVTWYHEMIDDWYKMSVGFNAKTDSFIASATGQHPDHVNYMICLSAHGPNQWRAIIALRYKIEHMCYEGEFPVDDQDFFLGGYK